MVTAYRSAHLTLRHWAIVGEHLTAHVQPPRARGISAKRQSPVVHFLSELRSLDSSDMPHRSCPVPCDSHSLAKPRDEVSASVDHATVGLDVEHVAVIYRHDDDVVASRLDQLQGL